MGLTNTVDMRDEVHNKLRNYVDEIKIRTKGNLNDGAVDAEGFFRNLLNLLYKFNLSKEQIESAHNDTIDLHCIQQAVCVQVTAQNNRTKVERTVKHFESKKRFNLYRELHFLILDRERSFNYDTDRLKKFGVDIIFHDVSTIFRKLQIDFDHPDEMYRVYDFVMKDLDKEYARKNREKSRDKGKKYNWDEELKGKHIVEQIYIVLQKFEGFNCIYPRTLSKLYPFNIERKTYDTYSNYCLKTSNKEIHNLLQKVKVNEDNEIVISDELLLPYSDKLKEIFTRLNYSLIHCICYREKYTEIEHHDISVIKDDINCTCNQCQYQNFNIQSLFPLLKGKYIEHSGNLVDALSEGYYLCKVGEHIKGWQVFNSVALKSQEQKKTIIHFLAQHNSYAIYNFVDSPWWESESKAILSKIEEIDLHEIISQSNVLPAVRDELIKVKEDYHLNYSREKIEEYAERINEVKELYANKGFSSGTTTHKLLRQEIHLLFDFYSLNCIITDDFFTFRSTMTKAVDAFFNSYTTDNRYEYRYKKFDCFVLMMMIFYVEENSIKRIFESYEIDMIEIIQEEKSLFIEIIINFFKAQFKTNTWSGPKFYEDIKRQEYFSHYRQLLRGLFNRIMLILSKVNLSIEELKPIAEPFTNFLHAAEDLNHSSWNFIACFLDRHIPAFDDKQIKDMLMLVVDEKNHRNAEDALKTICDSAAAQAKFVMHDEDFFIRLFESVSKPCRSCNLIHDMKRILAFWNIAGEKGRQLIKQKSIEYLDKSFDAHFYMESVFRGVFKRDDNTVFLRQFLTHAEKSSHAYDLKEEKGHWIFQSYEGYNCINCLSYLEVDFSIKEIQAIGKKSVYYYWLVNFEKYDYSNFNFKWLIDACPYYIKQKLYSVESLKREIIKELSINYNTELAMFYTKYLLKDKDENTSIA